MDIAKRMILVMVFRILSELSAKVTLNNGHVPCTSGIKCHNTEKVTLAVLPSASMAKMV
jgi:hypothetical protein